MSLLTFIVRELPSGEPFEVTDMYWFEENGIREVVNNIGKGYPSDFSIVIKEQE